MSGTPFPPSVFPTLAVVFAAGLALAGRGAWRLWRIARHSRQGHVADGEVVRVLPLARASGDALFVTIVAFADRSGARHEARAGSGASRPAYRLGQRVRVQYDPQSPERAEVVPESGLLVVVIALGCTIAIIAGVLLIAIGVAGMKIG